jgi:hypothetical protein
MATTKLHNLTQHAVSAWSVICGLGYAMTSEGRLDRNFAPVNPGLKQEEGHP